jgi:DNA uptake protein ComE-like DNA-binding protein
MHKNNFVFYSLAEKIAILILVLIIVLTFGLNVVLSRSNKAALNIPQNDSLIAAFERLHEELEDKKSFEYKPNTKSNTIIPRKESATLSEDNRTKNYSEKPQYIKQEKFIEAGSISLNETDTAQWKKVPGIGSTYAARIVKYRDVLGGFISINQLKEVYGVTDELFENIAPFISEDDIGLEHCVKLNVNKLEFKEILAHPYIDYEQTKAIVNLRRRTGNITSIRQLAMLDEFTAEDIKRITPYIDF